MESRKPKRKTVPLNTQVAPEIATALRQFAEGRDETMRAALELAIRRHIANPPPKLEIPPLPPVAMQDGTPKRKKPS